MIYYLAIYFDYSLSCHLPDHDTARAFADSMHKTRKVRLIVKIKMK